MIFKPIFGDWHIGLTIKHDHLLVPVMGDHTTVEIHSYYSVPEGPVHRHISLWPLCILAGSGSDSDTLTDAAADFVIAVCIVMKPKSCLFMWNIVILYQVLGTRTFIANFGWGKFLLSCLYFVRSSDRGESFTDIFFRFCQYSNWWQHRSVLSLPRNLSSIVCRVDPDAACEINYLPHFRCIFLVLDRSAWWSSSSSLESKSFLSCRFQAVTAASSHARNSHSFHELE